MCALRLPWSQAEGELSYINMLAASVRASGGSARDSKATAPPPKATLTTAPPELLARIEEYLDKDSLLAYIGCCKSMRTIGVRTLLLAYPVVLKTPVNVESFCDFMHADLPHRKPFLRSFTLDTPFPSSEIVLSLRGRLAHILLNASMLSYLAFGRCLKDIVEHSPALFSAIQWLPSLTTLKMKTESGSWPYVILRLQAAPLKEVDMGYLAIDAPDAFGKHAATLRSLTIGARSITTALGSTAYANMTSFCWTGATESGAWDIAAMIGLFPNLVKLSAWMRVRSSGSALTMFINSLSTMSFPYQAIRAENMEKQSKKRWSRLRRLFGDPNSLYILPLDCELDIISITDRLELWDCTEHIHDIVRDIRHPVGTLHLRYCPAWEPTLAENLGTLPPDALPEKSAHIINLFVVELFIPSDATSQKLWDIAAAWPVLIGRVAPQKVLLHVHVVRCPQAGGTFPTAAEMYVEEGGILSLGRVIAEASKATSTIYTMTSWHGGHRVEGWTNVGGLGSEPVVVKLSDAKRVYKMEKEVDGILFSLA
ncbi:unnamed protein product [Peniophora sp. CBMAI 1063]|nr:unnamed protein product [Peniophora sp. CBMAI 1063]